MSDQTLILHHTDPSIDVLAAVALLLERWPGAEVMAAKPPGPHEFGEVYIRDWPKVVWLLDMKAEPGSLVEMHSNFSRNEYIK